MRILSLDQASIKTAWSFFLDKELKDYDLINISKIKDKTQRFDKMLSSIINIINKYKPDIVVFEDVSLQTNVSTLVVLSRIQGCIISECIKNNILYCIYKPSTWRKILNFKQGRGIARKELKQQAIDFIRTKFDITNINDDIAESICIGLAFIIKDDFKERLK